MTQYVRRAEKKDISEILRLLVQVNLVHHLGRPDLFKKATKYNAAELEMIIADENTPVFVCISPDGKVCGHAFCIFKQVKESALLTDVKTLYIDDICVDEAARKCGVGRALYQHVIAFAKQQGCYNVTLNVWTCNPGAQKFYEAMGMVPQKIGMEVILQ